MPDLFKVAGPDGEPSGSVLLVHGLDGNIYDTWRCHARRQPWEMDDTFWPLWLAGDRRELAIYVVGYNAPISRLRGTAMHFTDQATSILARLLAEPVLAHGSMTFVGHSLGGLMIKQMLRTADSMARYDVRARALIERVEKVAFLGTPHSGSDLATWGDRLRILVRPTAATTSLVRNDPNLRDLNNWYRDWANNRTVAHLVLAEARPTAILGIIVPPDSADPGLPNVRVVSIDTNHLEICKPLDRAKDVYVLLRDFLSRPVQPAKPLSDEVAEKLLAALDARGGIERAAQAGLAKRAIFELARRLRPDEILDFDQAITELAAAVERAVEVREKGARGTNLGDHVDTVLARIAARMGTGDIEGAAREAEKGFAEWERAEAERHSLSLLNGVALLEAGLRQDILQRDAQAAALRVKRIVLLENSQDARACFEGMLKRQRAFLKSGRDKGINFDLLVAIEIGRLALHLTQDAKQRSTALVHLSQALAQLGERESDTTRLEEALANLRAALGELTSEREPLDWAVIQNDLGNVLLRLGERASDTIRLNEALTAHQAALTAHTRALTPLRWAEAQNNLGNVFLRLGEREAGTALLEKAVSSYRAALTEYTQERTPRRWATTQCNLGTALDELGKREVGTVRLKEAVTAYRAALTEKARERVSLQWTIQNNLGAALRELGAREGDVARLKEAVAVYREALLECTRERAPRQWAMIQINLANALNELGQRESGIARLEEALAAGRAALLENAREHSPLEWAKTQTALGITLHTLGKRESGSARLEEAVAAYRATLTVYTREHMPLDWAKTQANLGNTLLTLSARQGGTARLEEAVAAYRAALTAMDREREPFQWAGTQASLAAALRMLGEREVDNTRLEEALAACRASLTKYSESEPREWASSQISLGNVLWRLGQRESGTARLEEAVAAYRAALRVYTREREPLLWAMAQNNLGNALKDLGIREAGTAKLEEALAAYRAALTERTHERLPLDWAMTQGNLGNLLARLGERESDTAKLEEAVAAHQAALTVYTRERMPHDWAMHLGNEGVALFQLARRRLDIDMGRDAIDHILLAIKSLHDVGDEALAKDYECNLVTIAAILKRTPSDEVQKPG
jgi:tetratricopeptide (TPR) repeat protein